MGYVEYLSIFVEKYLYKEVNKIDYKGYTGLVEYYWHDKW